MSVIGKNRIITIGDGDIPAIREFCIYIDEQFPDRFDIEAIPFLRPTEDKSPSILLMEMHRQRPASLVILFDESSPTESYQSMSSVLLPAMNVDIPSTAKKMMEDLPPDPIVIANTGDAIKDSLIEGGIADAFEASRNEDKRNLQRLLKEKKDAATNLLLDGVPNPEGITIVQEMRRRGSPLADVPLLVLGLYPDGKEEFERIGGKNTLVFSSSDFSNLGMQQCFAQIRRFIESNVIERQK